MNPRRLNPLPLVALVATLALAACPTVSNDPCDPPCGVGAFCDEATGTCQPVLGPDLAAPVAGDDLAVGCNPPCVAPTGHCNAQHQCVGCLTDDHCPAGQVCRVTALGASCVPGCSDDSRCAAGQKCCDQRCADVTKDPANCGACGVACQAAHARSTCAAGSCALGACDVNWADCNKDALDGCEANVRADEANCGACGLKCSLPNAITGCAGACYLKACLFGFDDCNGDEKDGCETDVASDVRNCGRCGGSCGSPANGVATCASSVCQISKCNQGFGDCDRTFQNGCEANLQTSAAHCGACGAACAQGLVCVNGSCTCPNCNLANAKTACVNLRCVVDSCFPNFGNCDAQDANGCETPLGNDKNNCGACANVCAQNLVCINGGCTCQNCNFPNANSRCVNGQCILDKCSVGWGNCDGNDQNGCETNLTNDKNNCGACGLVCPPNKQTCLASVCGAIDLSGVFSELMSDGRKVYIWKTGKCAVLANETNFCQNRGLSWWRPKSQNDANALIQHAYDLDKHHTWVQVHGLQTTLGTVGGFNVGVDSPDCVEGSQTGFAAFRKWGCSFCDPESNNQQQNNGQSCCWDKDHQYDWFVCE